MIDNRKHNDLRSFTMDLNGVLLLNKPRGMTSHDCVVKLRRILGTKQVGHTGTLDPDVDGVLPICVGSATKLVQFLTAETKEYIGEITIGFSTTTEDASGEIVDRKPITEPISQMDIGKAFISMLGPSIQTPPMYSAVKVHGQKLYAYARAGETVERPTREVIIYELEPLSNITYNNDCATFKFRICGSKGIFVRTVAVTIGEKLGYPAHMSDLTRIASGDFKLENCVTLEQVEAGEFQLLSTSEALTNFPSVQVDHWVEKLIRNGVKLRPEQIIPPMREGLFLTCNQAGTPLAIYEWCEAKEAYVSVRGLW